MQDLSTAVRNTILALFWALVALFLFMLMSMFFDDMLDSLLGALMPEPFLFMLGILILIAGILFVLTLWQPIETQLKRFLLLASGSIIAVVFSVVLHNFFYAMAELTQDTRIIHTFFEWLHAAFFIVGLLLFPITFVAGCIGVVYKLFRTQDSPADCQAS